MTLLICAAGICAVVWLWPRMSTAGKAVVFALWALMLFASTAQVAFAADPCPQRAGLVEELDARFGERAESAGLSALGIVEVFVSDETGTWTIVLNKVDGTTCLIASGRAWGAVPGEAKGEPT